MEFVYVILALVLGLIAGFALGVRVKYENFKAQIEKSRQVSRQTDDDVTVVPGFESHQRTRVPATDGLVVFPAAYTGSVFVTLWLPSEIQATDTDVEITWGAARATITLTALDSRGVTLKFDKGSADDTDAKVQVRTSVPAYRIATIDCAYEGVPVREDLVWA